MQRLPNEIILHIVECLIPPNSPVAFNPAHSITRTLVSLTVVARLTSSIAKRLLLKHCLYIDSKERLRKLVSIIKPESITDPAVNGSPGVGLFLAPFPPGDLDDLSIARDVNTLFSALSNTLTRLIINMPLRYLYPEDDERQVRPVLREAFCRLTAVEEFCSMQDELYLTTKLDTPSPEPDVWASWRRLRRLALYNSDVSFDRFLDSVKGSSELTHLVLTRADGVYDTDIDIKPEAYKGLTKLERVIIVNTEQDFIRDKEFHRDMRESAEGTFMGNLRKAWAMNHKNATQEEWDNFCTAVCVPISEELEEGDDTHITSCQSWVGNRAIDGALWDTPGRPFLDW